MSNSNDKYFARRAQQERVAAAAAADRRAAALHADLANRYEAKIHITEGADADTPDA